ncbi:MAG: hypothetical protein B7Z08_03320 [Sphingomonadales bacterium 32-68-7]|nr:MAG: hypothetical protein B7Z33_05150 [Sphingomonadales bacterium 12-68-11]OYX09873.1 MAG: hypothetical protein B7Z08_03320 [Sphingomonadales bacterium 32-68-7]
MRLRAALISLAGSQAVVAGRSLALRQLDFALAAGATRIYALGDGASPAALALAQAAEQAGARCQAIRDGRGLLGTLAASDELLVLVARLLPESREALERLATPGILTLPAVAGVGAGFERIDLERASAGALVVPGALVERLADLPADYEPAAALLRIALQAGVAERRLPEAALSDGAWALAGDAAAAAELGDRWLDRRIRQAPRYALSARVAEVALRGLALRLLDMPGAARGLAAVALVLQLGAAALCAWVSPAAGFGVLALGAAGGVFAERFGALARAPSVRARRVWTSGLSEALTDAALVACAALAIPGETVHRLFAPLVLIAALRASRIAGWPGAAALLGDRALLAVGFAAAAGFGRTEPAIMLAGLAILLLQIAREPAKVG